MAKARSTPSPSQQLVASLGLPDGNGHDAQAAKTAPERLAEIEILLERIQVTLETQFKRMADMQVLIDRLNADRHR